MAMEAASTKRSYIRLGAMRLLLEGMGRELVCKIYNRSDRMVRLWIEMFNRGGIDALASKPRSGRSRKVKLERYTISWCRCSKSLRRLASCIGPGSSSMGFFKSGSRSH